MATTRSTASTRKTGTITGWFPSKGLYFFRVDNSVTVTAWGFTNPIHVKQMVGSSVQYEKDGKYYRTVQYL
jgi:hypothetical protein